MADEARWYHRRIKRVSLLPHLQGQTWHLAIDGHDVGPPVLLEHLYYAVSAIRHEPYIGEAYSELLTPDGFCLMATLGEEVVWRAKK